MEMDDLKIYELSELNQKNGVISAQIWVGYKGLIYDVTTSDLFAGGKHYAHVAGTDLTDFMPDAPHTEQVMSRFPVVGKLNSAQSDAKPIVQSAQAITVAQPVAVRPAASFAPVNQLIVAAVKEFDAQIIAIKDIGKSTRLITFHVADITFTYTPGQYINIQIELNGERIIKSYSIVGKTQQKNQFSILVAYRHLGKMTDFLFHKISVHNRIKIKAPYGKFITSNFIVKDLIFIANDVSIASVYTHIYYLLKDKKIIKNISLIYGNHFYADFVFHEEFIEMAKLHSNFTYLPVADRESNRNWSYAKSSLKATLEANVDVNAEYYITGWKDIVETAVNVLKLRGISPLYIKTELFN